MQTTPLAGLSAPTGNSLARSDRSERIESDHACSGQNLLTDGDFETPVVPAGDYQDFELGSSLGAWTVIGPAGGSVSLVNESYVENGYTFNPESGVQSLDLTGDGNNVAEGVQQTVTLQANQNTRCVSGSGTSMIRAMGWVPRAKTS